LKEDGRIKKHPILKFDRGKKVYFYFNGKKVEGYENETVAAALYAMGVRIFSRSFKYHRPRGFFCAIGKCSSCLMRVNGVPNVRTCMVRVQEGMVVESEHAFPSAEHDIYSVMDYIPFISKPGFYLKTFIRPRFLYGTYQKVIRKFTGLGKFPTKKAVYKPPKENPLIETDIAVIGGGPAGLSAAIYAAKLGANVILIDENWRLGGQLIKQTHRFFGSARHEAGIRGIRIAEDLTRQVEELKDKITVMLEATATGYYAEGIIGVVQKGKFIKIKPKRTIIATGAYERTLVFENNDLPGVYGAGGVQTLMNVYGVKPGNEGLMVGAGNVGLIVTYQLLQAGVKVKAIVEAMPKVGGYLVHAAKVRRLGVPIYTRHTILKAYGNKKVEGAIIVELDDKWNPIPGTEKNIKCDFICISVGLNPTHELLYQAGATLKYVRELGGFVPLRNKYMETDAKGVFVAGDASGIEEASTAIMEGRIAGITAALQLGYGDESAIKLREEIMKDLEEMRSGPFGEPIVRGIKKVLIEEGAQ